MTWHYRLPWNSVRWFYRWKRSRFFNHDRYEGPHYVVEHPIERVEADLGSLSYGPHWEFSYDLDEDLNLARIVYHDGEWWQNHVRGYDHGDETWLNAHWEREPTEHPRPHIKAEGLDVSKGMDILRMHLDRLYGDFDLRGWPDDV